MLLQANSPSLSVGMIWLIIAVVKQNDLVASDGHSEWASICRPLYRTQWMSEFGENIYMLMYAVHRKCCKRLSGQCWKEQDSWNINQTLYSTKYRPSLFLCSFHIDVLFLSSVSLITTFWHYFVRAHSMFLLWLLTQTLISVSYSPVLYLQWTYSL